ncbi:MAG: DVU0298 family protein [Thermodesulfobacteriota bacterium]
MGSRAIKKEILHLLNEDDLGVIRKKTGNYPEKDLINPLFSGLYRPEERIRWHAVSIFGEVLNRLAERDMEAARIVMRRFLWSLNDESGGIGWGAPEAMAEAMRCHKRLRDEYLHMLISYMRQDGPLIHQDGNFLELPELQRGLLWGIGRLASEHDELLRSKGVLDDLPPYLLASDGQVRGLSAWCLGLLGASVAKKRLETLVNDPALVRLYLDGEIREITTGELARQALDTVLETV